MLHFYLRHLSSPQFALYNCSNCTVVILASSYVFNTITICAKARKGIPFVLFLASSVVLLLLYDQYCMVLRVFETVQPCRYVQLVVSILNIGAAGSIIISRGSVKEQLL